ncbi:oligosaccharide flippase family protein [uncultured Aquimarina sp.]|uniref:oligosaccharide flippase family protein n=1 Tax=uncultured Aquimarina sp. TaxID=575652 RepID=UPI002619BED6|nr:polysaccharide biosynthesis C-terminal domain-containing protein [uncultured Aquimarina sp.]
MNKSLESILTRLISIATKFILVTFLAKTLTLSEYGIYQLVTYFTLISVYVFGMEYYMYGNREVAKGENNLEKISTHVNFFMTLLPITFSVQFIGLFILLPHEILNPLNILIILFINFCDYFNQEVYRYLIMIQRIGKANLLLVIKSLTLMLLIVFYYLSTGTLTIEITLLLMFVSYFILLISTSFLFYKFILLKRKIKIVRLSRNNFKEIFRFLKPFIGLMICTKGLEFFDKFAIEYYLGTTEVGIYGFLFSIASLIHVFVVSGFYIVYLPELVKLHENKNKVLLNKMYKFSLLTFVSSIILSIGEVLSIGIILNIINKNDIVDNLNVLYILLGAFFFLNLTLIPRLVLYVSGEDNLLMVVTAATFVLNVILNLILIRFFSIEGAAVALLLTYFVGFLIITFKGNKVWSQIKTEFL